MSRWSKEARGELGDLVRALQYEQAFGNIKAGEGSISDYPDILKRGRHMAEPANGICMLFNREQHAFTRDSNSANRASERWK